MRRALVLVIDGFGAGYLGPYGNTWLETPALNQWACQSVLFQQCFSEAPDPLTLYQAIFQGHHPLATSGTATSPTFAAQLAQHEIPVHLFSDEPKLAPLRGEADLSSVELLPPYPPQEAESGEETELARMFSVLLDWLAEPAAEEVVWAHARGMQGLWDAPYEYRASFADEEDPPPPAMVEKPFERENRPLDPDRILGITQAYAGQVLVLDLLLAELLTTIAELPPEVQPLVVLTSSGGFPLGLHGQVGRGEEAPPRLYGDSVHVPLLVRWPDAKNGLTRVQGMVGLEDLPSAILRWMLPPSEGEGSATPMSRILDFDDAPPRPWILSGLDSQRYFRTPAWSGRFHLSVDPTDCIDPITVDPTTLDLQAIPPELFVKPDDRWEINNIADRSRETAEALVASAILCEQATRTGQQPEAVELPEILTQPLG
ncbi:MAG: sulfatase-like hydrolase/transferase [Pirellulaceae bacterium]